MADDAMMDAEGLRALAEATSVSEVMSRDVFCLSMDTSIDAVVDLFLEKDLAQAPVVDAAWRPLGMVSKNDLLRLFDAQQRGLFTGEARVSQVVVQSVISIHHDASLSVAAAIMANEGVHALPIVAQGG